MLRVPILDNIGRKGKVRNGLLKIYLILILAKN